MTELTQIEQLSGQLTAQKQAFLASPYPSYQQRLADLKALKRLLLDNQQRFIDALSQDFGHRSADDTRIGDLLSTVQGINYSIKKLKGWMKPQGRHVGILFQPASAKVMYQPVGVVGIIVPWNYPLFLALGPLTTAIAAGNRAMIKTSEFTPHTSRVLAEVLGQHFSKDQVCVVAGEADMAAAFSKLQFDHLFFTGSTNVGRLVMKAAAENLVPVTLELGGKSPAIIDPEMNVETAVNRFILGKTLNAGQTCVAPDYLLCHSSKIDELVDALRGTFNALFPTVCNNQDCTAVVNDGHYQRLQGLLKDAEEKGATIIALGEHSDSDTTRQMPLTLVLNPTDEMQVMQQEIFGPILPIVSCDSIDSAIDYVNERPRPLALYLYSFNKQVQQRVLERTHAGGVGLNDATFHVVIDDLPFGGVGPSGMGNYHGEEGFKTFSHAKSVFKRGKVSLVPLLFPPFGKSIHKMLYKMFIR